MKIGIIDADLIGRDKHRFPNLVCEKISAYWKEKGAKVELLLNYDNFRGFSHVYIAKVFTDTPCPVELYDEKWLKNHPKIHIGGTGFYFDKAPNLPDEIEHHMPDYHLYDDWIYANVERAVESYMASLVKEEELTGILDENKEKKAKKFKEKYMIQFKEYLDYSIGFVTRGCFRKCGFCVNKKYDHVFVHSPLSEFFDPERKKICLLDDNFLGCPQWREILDSIIATGRQFKFKQGLDELLLTDEKCKMLFTSKYDGDFTFAFDKITDYDLIKSKLELISKYKGNKSVKFYVLVAYESIDHYDIEKAFIRIELLLRYGCLPYLMRFQNVNDAPWKKSEYRDLYVAMARWCNQPCIIKKMSFRQFCEANQALKKPNKDGVITKCSTLRCMEEFEKKYPEIAKRFFDIRMEEIRIDKK